MALPKLKDVLGSVAAVSLVMTPLSAADAQSAHTQNVAAVSEVKIPFKDARSAGAGSVRFAAAQYTQAAPTIVLLGMSNEKWPAVRQAIRQAVADGYRVEGVFMGPTNAAPALEIYAKGTLVTNPIDPNTVAPERLTQVIREVSTRMYPRTLAMHDAPAPRE
ncbi:MAG TPA: hypothetical protein VJM34_14365 [Novosphingobium sp.]|nr:hypothetical protein [Novosphingobium sp.]